MKATKNSFQVLTTEGSKPTDIAITEKEVYHQENKEDEPVLIEIGQEASYELILPQQLYVEVRPKSSQNSRGSVTRSRAKEQLEDTS